ncbi:MAG: SRPBCC family protein [Gemmatimonadaceae bacterium]|nr:SRPBCC family protein [Gemmatimonadaceae bacterium]
MIDRVRDPFDLGPMPPAARMMTVDQRHVTAPLGVIFALARDVARWPELLAHYRRVSFVERAADGGGVVIMEAVRPFGVFDWPTRWTSEMQVSPGTSAPPWIRFRHIRGVTRGMEVLWAFRVRDGGTTVTIVHLWNGPAWPVIGEFAACRVIGPVFVHGIASRTLAGLARVAERSA